LDENGFRKCNLRILFMCVVLYLIYANTAAKAIVLKVCPVLRFLKSLIVPNCLTERRFSPG